MRHHAMRHHAMHHHAIRHHAMHRHAMHHQQNQCLLKIGLCRHVLVPCIVSLSKTNLHYYRSIQLSACLLPEATCYSGLPFKCSLHWSDSCIVSSAATLRCAEQYSYTMLCTMSDVQLGRHHALHGISTWEQWELLPLMQILFAIRKIKLAKPTTWSKEEITGMKREALLDCFDTMQACYGHAWARTSVDLAVEVGCLLHPVAVPKASLLKCQRVCACHLNVCWQLC